MTRALRLLAQPVARLLALIGFVAAVAAAPAGAQPSAFPHDKHARLFPQCAGCHAGITSGERAKVYPDTARCTSCHNGRDQKRVPWRGPTRAPSNLKFEHGSHAAATASDGAACTNCHATGGGWMQVGRATPTACLGCHTHRAPSHLAAEARCGSCHVPLVQATALSAARVGAFPKPPSHDTAGFATAHAASAAATPQQCVTCHARETCMTCHVNGRAVAASFGLEPDARVASLVRGRAPRYVAPASHGARDFADTHSAAARAPTATCATCHTRSSCAQCHTGTLGADAIARLQEAEPGSAPGVALRVQVPRGADRTADARAPLGAHATLGDTVPARTTRTVQIHAPGFSRTHGVQAATQRPSCEGCHAKSYCVQCHAGESSRRFHKANFVARHAPEAYGRETDCQQCHSREVFCRSCHVQVGLSAQGRTAGGYHNGTSLWIIQHGQAARQSLPTCTTCHQQRDCMQCHSRAGRNINPHGPGFDAERAWKANRLICLRCHFKDPLGR